MNSFNKSMLALLFLTTISYENQIKASDSFTDSTDFIQEALSLPLHAIILNSNYTLSDKLAAMQDLLDNKKVDINAQDRDGRTALNLATYYKKEPEIINFLVQHGAQVNKPDNFNATPLINSIKYNEIPTAAILLAVGADKTHKNDEGQTSLDLARTEGTKSLLGVDNKKNNE